MEWIWYIIAALGAGIGTGLAELSAATVMVPILIVLCPSFAGETGAYQATAIALASDILGSAVTTYTYAKHKNIDLKRGWIMLVCILGMWHRRQLRGVPCRQCDAGQLYALFDLLHWHPLSGEAGHQPEGRCGKG